MKKNKGYTLVELLVSMVVLMIVLTEVYVVMNNGSNVYNKGSYDVSLQMKAQQALMHIENILIDANDSVSYCDANAMGDNGKLIITNDPGYDYVITFDNSDPVGTLYGYGRLMLTQYDDETGTVISDVPLCDNVVSYRAVTDEIEGKTGDSVFINLMMANKESKYSTQTKEIYLRNRLGTRNSVAAPTGGSTSSNFTINVLRHKDYPLDGNRYYISVETIDALGNVAVQKTYCSYFEWQSDDGTSSINSTDDPNNNYALVNNNTVKCNAGMDKKVGWGNSAAAVLRGYEDAAHRASDPNKFCTITLTTDPVGVGGVDISKSAGYINLDVYTSQAFSNATKIYGISVEGADEVDYTFYSCPKQTVKYGSTPSGRAIIKNDPANDGTEITYEGLHSSTAYNDEVRDVADNTITSTDILFAQDITSGAGGGDVKFYPDNDTTKDYSNLKTGGEGGLYLYLDANTNCFASYSKAHQTNNRFQSFKNENYMFYVDTTIKYPGGSDQVLEFPCFFIYTSFGDVDMDTGKLLFEWANLEAK